MKQYSVLTALLISSAVCNAQSGERVTPEQLAKALPELEKIAEQTLKKSGVPGMAIVVIHQDKVVYLKGFGVRQVGKAERVDGDTVFQLASVSKPMATTVLAALVGEGKIDWDDKIADRLPGFRLFDPLATRDLTLRDLLCHRSGLPSFAGDLLEDMGYERAEILLRLRYLKPASSFRSQYAYTNFGLTAAAVAGAKAAGKEWEDLAAEKLYRPLGMKATSSRYRDFEAATNRAHLHVPIDGKWVAKHVRNADAQSPAGGVSASARDLAQWLRLQLAGGKFEGKQIVSSKALLETHRPQIVSGFNPETNRAFFYGLGWNVSYDENGRVFWKHSGAFFLGVRTEVALLPAENLAIACLTNAAPTGLPEGINASFFDLVLHGKATQDWIDIWNKRFDGLFKESTKGTSEYSQPPAKPLLPLPNRAYAGFYHNDLYGAFEVIEKDGSLHVRFGPKKLELPLRHWNRDVFVFQPVGESAGGLSGAIFTVGPDGKASRVVVEYLNEGGQGTFERKVPNE